MAAFGILPTVCASSVLSQGGYVNRESLPSQDKVFRGEVKKVFTAPSGQRVAETEVLGTGIVSFSLDPKVWDGEDEPVTGEDVLLQKLRLVREKWRALIARRIRP